MLFARVQVAVLSVVLVPSLAAAAVGDCVELARTIVYNNTRSYSEEEQRQINKADFCSERYKHDQTGRSLQIEASYEVFSGGVKGSEQQIHAEQDKQCGGKYDDSWRKSMKSNEARIASSDALAVVSACLELERRGLSQKATIASDGSEFVLSLQWNGAIPSPIKVNYMGPTRLKGYSCKIQDSEGGLRDVMKYKDASATIQNGGSHTLNCELPAPQKVTRDGEEHICYRETLVEIATQGPPATIRLPKVCTPSMPGKRAEAIETKLKGAEGRIESLSAELEKVKTDVNQASANLETYKKTAADDLKSNFTTLSITDGACVHGFPCILPAQKECSRNGFTGSSVLATNQNSGHAIVACFGKK